MRPHKREYIHTDAVPHKPQRRIQRVIPVSVVATQVRPEVAHHAKQRLEVTRLRRPPRKGVSVFFAARGRPFPLRFFAHCQKQNAEQSPEQVDLAQQFLLKRQERRGLVLDCFLDDLLEGRIQALSEL